MLEMLPDGEIHPTVSGWIFHHAVLNPVRGSPEAPHRIRHMELLVQARPAPRIDRVRDAELPQLINVIISSRRGNGGPP